MNTGSSIQEKAGIPGGLEDCLATLEKERAATRHFIAMARHELSQPITALRCGLEVTARLPFSEMQFRERMQDMIDEVDRIIQFLEAATR